MDIRILAVLLVTGHLASAFFISRVLILQIPLFKARRYPELKWFRRILFTLALAIFIGNFIPILIDGLTIVDFVHRSTKHVNSVGVAYSISNALVFSLSALLIWFLYRLAARTLIIVDHDRSVALEEGEKNV